MNAQIISIRAFFLLPGIEGKDLARRKEKTDAMTENKSIGALRRLLTMTLALVMVLGAAIPLITQEASAKGFSGKKGSTYTVTDGGRITYGSGEGGYSNSRKCDLGDDLGSRYSYCVQPSKASPGTGTVTVDKVITDVMQQINCSPHGQLKELFCVVK